MQCRPAGLISQNHRPARFRGIGRLAGGLLALSVALSVAHSPALATRSVGNVTVAGTSGNQTISFDLGAAATSATCAIYSETNPTTPVRQIPLGSLAKGVHSVTWDGRNGAGVKAPSGNYYAKIIANANPVGTLTLLTIYTNLGYAGSTNNDGRGYWGLTSNVYTTGAAAPFHNLTYYPTIDDNGTVKYSGVHIIQPDATSAGRISSGNTAPIGDFGCARFMPDGKVLVSARTGGGTNSGFLKVVDPGTGSLTAFPKNGTDVITLRDFVAYGTSAAPRIYAIDDGSTGLTAGNIYYYNFSGGVAPNMAGATPLVTAAQLQGAGADVVSIAMNRAEDTMWVSMVGNNGTVTSLVKKFVRTTSSIPGTWAEADGSTVKRPDNSIPAKFTFPAAYVNKAYSVRVCLSPDEQTLWTGVADFSFFNPYSAGTPNFKGVVGLNPGDGSSRGAAYTISGLSRGAQCISQEGSFDGTTYTNGNLHITSYSSSLTPDTSNQTAVLAPPDGATTDATQSKLFAIAWIPTHIGFVTQPANAVLNAGFPKPPAVAVLDTDNEVFSTYTGPVTVALLGGTGTPGAVLSGTTTVNAVDGIASFPDLSINKVGTGYVLTADSGAFPQVLSNPFSVLAPVAGIWGDVDEDGLVTLTDAQIVTDYIANPTTYGTKAQRERIVRYGDVAGVVNRSDVGNGTIDVNDTDRLTMVAGGTLDPGTAGPTHPTYGDVNGDGVVTIADAVYVNRSRYGNVSNATVLARINTPGGGDVSPTVPFVTFGDGAITMDDVAVITARARGGEINPPAYNDYWPMHLAHPGELSDQYFFTDLNGKSGDFNHQTAYDTQTKEEYRGYTVVKVVGTDGSVAGVFKGIDGSLYALYVQYPLAFNSHRIDFREPIKVLDAKAAVGSSWKGDTFSTADVFGIRPTHYKTTILSRGDTYTPAAGNYPSATPKSTWSGTVRVRIDMALLAIPTSNFDMQQAFFFDFAPGIGVVRRGQAPIQGAPAPTSDRPLLELDSARVRNITYNQFTPVVP